MILAFDYGTATWIGGLLVALGSIFAAVITTGRGNRKDHGEVKSTLKNQNDQMDRIEQALIHQGDRLDRHIENHNKGADRW
jgi:hypothetical protein